MTSRERTPESVARVDLWDLERGHKRVFLEPGDEIELPAERVKVVVLEPWGDS